MRSWISLTAMLLLTGCQGLYHADPVVGHVTAEGSCSGPGAVIHIDPIVRVDRNWTTNFTIEATAPLELSTHFRVSYRDAGPPDFTTIFDLADLERYQRMEPGQKIVLLALDRDVSENYEPGPRQWMHLKFDYWVLGEEPVLYELKCDLSWMEPFKP